MEASKLSQRVQTMVADRTRVVRREQTVDQEAIKTNALFKIAFATNLKPEERKAEIAKLLRADKSKAELKNIMKELEAFMEYLATVDQQMSTEIIKLTDTDTFSELQRVYGDLNGGLVDFQEAMTPLTSILEAIFKLRVEGKTYDAFLEIRKDKENERIRNEKLETLNGDIDNINRKVRDIQNQIAIENNNTSWMNFGGLTKDAKNKIAVLNNDLNSEMARLSTIQSEIGQLESEKSVADNSEIANEKRKLRELLDITSDEHKARQELLVDKALKFKDTANDRIGSVRAHLSKMTDQMDRLHSTNNQLNSIYTILNEGIAEASKTNLELVKEVESKLPTTTDAIAKMDLEDQLDTINTQIRVMDTARADGLTTSADIKKKAINIKTMKDANEQQIAAARTMQTQGVSKVASQLSVVLNAVSGAALGESSAMAKDTLLRMSDFTNEIAQKEVIRVAANIDTVNNDILKAVEDVAEYGNIMQSATEITRKGLEDMQQNLAALKEATDEVAKEYKENASLHTSVNSGTSAKKIQNANVGTENNPFAI